MLKTNYFKLALLALVIGLSFQNVQGQCLDWIAPTNSTGWTNFNSQFGGAPCDDGTGCPTNEITSFEVFASEAYAMDNIQLNGTYSFSICNGPGAGSWVPEFTIIAPSGAVDAFGAGDGDGCTITWTATEEGTYLIVINEAGQCGGGPNTGTDNGYPAITCSAGTSCGGCAAGTLSTTDSVSVCPGQTFDLMLDSDTIPVGGGRGWLFSDSQGGTGGVPGGLLLTNQPDTISYDADLNGILSFNGLDELMGTWVIYGAVYSDVTDAFNTICGVTTDSLTVTFLDGVNITSVVDNADGTATVNAAGGGAPYTYEWSNGETTQTATGLTAGETYSVTVTDADGCSDTGSVVIGGVGAPCLDWSAPSDSTGWTNFNSQFGGAPCDDGTGCPFNEITSFEVYASEAYVVDNFQAGGTYSFSICNGPGAGSWVPDFTIIAPSGAVDAFGLGDGDGCTITWVASEDGTYLIVINEAGQCGGGPNTATDNGFPALTCSGGAVCDLVCEAGTLTTNGAISLCSSDATFDLNAENVEIPSGGAHGWLFDNNTGGTGALDGPFVLLNTPTSSTYDSDLNGVLSSNSLPLLSGTWVLKSAVYSNPANAFNSICSVSSDSLVVTFATEGPSITTIEDNGNGGAEVTVTGGAPPYTYLWDDDDMQTTATASDLAPGDYTVVVTDANGCTAEGTVTVVSTGVGYIEGLQELEIMPNPTSGQFSVLVVLTTPELVKVSVLDITGKELQQVEKRLTNDRFDLNMDNQPAGVYLLKVSVGGDVLTRRLVVTP